MLKYMGTELNKKRYELMSARGTEALDTDGAHGRWRSIGWDKQIQSRGTSEIMLGIISRRILGLPG